MKISNVHRPIIKLKNDLNELQINQGPQDEPLTSHGPCTNEPNENIDLPQHINQDHEP